MEKIRICILTKLEVTGTYKGWTTVFKRGFYDRENRF